MQETRQYILEILKERRQATVDEIVEELRKRRGKITAVTARHHLARLQQDGLITSPQLRHRSTPGRPQHVYALTEVAWSHFPNNYQCLSVEMLKQLQSHLPLKDVKTILKGVADGLAAEISIPDGPMPERLDAVVNYMSQQGYGARWEATNEGYLLFVSNCPYYHIASEDNLLCAMDVRMIESLLEVAPRPINRISAGDPACSYVILDQ